MKIDKTSSSQPLRILQVLLSLEPGGLENGVVNLSNGLDPKYFETRIACLERVGGFAERLAPRIAVTCLEKRPGFRLTTLWQLAREIRRFRPDVIHTHNLGPLIYGALARYLSYGTGARLLHGEHGTLHGDQVGPRRLRQRRWLYRACARVHTVSASLRQHLVDLGFPGRKIVAVLNGVDCHRFRPAADQRELRQRLGVPENALVLGMVGRLIASKRHDLFLEALRKLPDSFSGRPVHGVIVGDGGQEREAIVAAIRQHPRGARLHWAGHQDNPVRWYQVMDLLVMPSSVEGLSNALLESMACGVPCLAHPACGASEVILDGENGWLAEMPSGDVLAGRLGALLSDESALLRVGRNARKAAERRFSLDAMVARYAALFKEVAGWGR